MSQNRITGKTRIVHRHLRFGWWSLLCFLSLGIALETMHGFKVGYYLDTNNETRRLMWTLAHTHGTLLSIVHLVFAATLRILPQENSKLQRLASPCLCGAGILMPGGFFLGGLIFYGGDPGIGILLLPVGALLLLLAVSQTALSLGQLGEKSDPKAQGKAEEAASPDQ
ncbi:MAG: hypothetical protein NZ935_01655 [Planctomycetes bacterium]|nr:hypothetical protein [Planctomycetota bacterium]